MCLETTTLLQHCAYTCATDMLNLHYYLNESNGYESVRVHAAGSSVFTVESMPSASMDLCFVLIIFKRQTNNFIFWKFLVLVYFVFI